MYIAAVDRAAPEDWPELLRRTEVVTLVAADGDGGEPVVVPTHVGLAGPADHPVVEVHLHRAPPFWDAVAERPTVTVSVVGPFVFIPHDWNPRPGSDPVDGVPTSWYAAATLRCRLEPVDDPAELAALLTRLAERFEPVGLDRPVDPVSPPYGPLLGAIRGARLHVESVEAKTKFGGNRPAELRRSVIARLEERAGPGDPAAADWARRTLDRPTG
jgi:transcriptional regulator